jgi:hypothetical protein
MRYHQETVNTTEIYLLEYADRNDKPEGLMFSKISLETNRREKMNWAEANTRAASSYTPYVDFGRLQDPLIISE